MLRDLLHPCECVAAWADGAQVLVGSGGRESLVSAAIGLPGASIGAVIPLQALGRAWKDSCEGLYRTDR
jgi:hypothetical protein